MPRRETTLITLEKDELDRLLERASTRAVRQFVRTHDEQMERISRNLELARGLVTKDTLCWWLGRSKDTIDRWGIPIDCKKGRQSFYWLPDVVRYLRDRSEGKDPTGSPSHEAAGDMQEALDRALSAVPPSAEASP